MVFGHARPHGQRGAQRHRHPQFAQVHAQGRVVCERVPLAEASLLTPYGPARAAWAWRDAQIDLEVTIPDGATAEVRLPDGTVHHDVTGTRDFTSGVSHCWRMEPDFADHLSSGPLQCYH